MTVAPERRMESKTFCFCICAVIVIAWTVEVGAHHSGSRFDKSKIVEVEGELVSISWRNPHIRMQIREIKDSGEEVIWDLEGDSLSILRRTNASPEGLNKGDRVRVAGNPTVRSSNEISVHNLLAPDGREILLKVSAEPRWSERVSGDETVWFTGGTGGGLAEEIGIFRVWSTDLSPGSTVRTFWRDDYPLTESARVKHGAWNPLTDTTAPGCEPKGMPLIMEQRHPMEFVQTEDRILLRMEEYDTVRTIHMQADSPDGDPQTPILGYSTGRWQDDSLIVTTVGVDFPYFDSKGTPQGSNPNFVERFWVSEDGSRLEYEITATDDEIFTEPVTLTRDWVWRPGEQVRPYECDQS